MKTGRNDPCPCGSGKKYKKCCQDNFTQQALASLPGSEGLIGATASVVSSLQTSNKARYVVRIQVELWNANSSDILKAEELVTVTGVNGLTLFVQRINRLKEEHSSI